jgi:hypothetical protein
MHYSSQSSYGGSTNGRSSTGRTVKPEIPLAGRRVSIPFDSMPLVADTLGRAECQHCSPDIGRGACAYQGKGE